MPYTDRTVVCADCQSPFTFTAGEQEFHASKGFSNDPRRCPDCRAARKQNRPDGGGYSSGGGGGRREMFPVVCSECGRDTQVPFQPSGNRPVYCSDCFSKQSGGDRGGYGGGGSRGGGGGRRGGGGGGGGRR